MPTIRTAQVLQLGRNRDLDPSESFRGAENAGDLIGRTFGSTNDPLWATRTAMTFNDGNSNGNIPFAGSTPSPSNEFVSVGGANRSIDTGIAYNATFRYADGTVGNGLVRVLQDGAGNMYMVPPPRDASAAEVQTSTGKPIVSITINRILQNDFTDLNTDRFGLPGDPTFPCFCKGTMILTPHGERPVESLSVGDSVVTQDNGVQQIRWIGSKSLAVPELAANRNLLPVVIRQGALGDNAPAQDLMVSQQHRILVRSRVARNMFGAEEILVAAKHLTGLAGVELLEEPGEVTYFHLLFDAHEVVQSNGLMTESLFIGKQALSDVGPALRDEILALFPELAEEQESFTPARPFINGRQGRNLVERHQKHDLKLQIN